MPHIMEFLHILMGVLILPMLKAPLLILVNFMTHSTLMSAYNSYLLLNPAIYCKNLDMLNYTLAFMFLFLALFLFIYILSMFSSSLYFLFNIIYKYSLLKMLITPSMNSAVYLFSCLMYLYPAYQALYMYTLLHYLSVKWSISLPIFIFMLTMTLYMLHNFVLPGY